MVFTKIQSEPIHADRERPRTGYSGAQLQFYGIVRKIENGKEISKLEYTYYTGMAESELQKLAETARQKFDLNRIEIIHRIGEIGVNEISMMLDIHSEHRKEAIEAMDWTITEIKKEIPIWKKAIFIDGTAEHVDCRH